MTLDQPHTAGCQHLFKIVGVEQPPLARDAFRRRARPVVH
jgi:hypothetical protein